jgi:hypothetical protein
MSDYRTNGVSLREYIERILDEKQKALELAFKAQQDALALARHDLENRLETLNKLRQEVTEDRSQLVSTDKFEAMETRMRTLEGWRASALGAGAVLGLLAGLIGAFIERAVIK